MKKIKRSITQTAAVIGITGLVGSTIIKAVLPYLSDSSYAQEVLRQLAFWQKVYLGIVIVCILWNLTIFGFALVKKRRPQKNNVYESYDKIAGWFDTHRSRELFEKPYLDKAISHLKPGATILDLGCGMGEPIAKYLVEKGYRVTGVDGSSQLINLAKSRIPNATFLVRDMRACALGQTFDCIIAWHSLFHLSPDDQRAMFKMFQKHIAPGGILMFTSGSQAEEVWGDNGGENLYHASLSLVEYKELLAFNRFKLLTHVVEDPDCGQATVWIARFIKP